MADSTLARKRPYKGRYIKKAPEGYFAVIMHYLEPDRNTIFFKTIKDAEKSIDDFLAWTQRNIRV